MTSVLLFTFLGEWIKKNWTIIIKKKQKKFSKKTRNIIKIWNKFGVWGVAFLTPIIFTPIGGTVILTSFGISKRKILLTMILSALLWSFIFGLSIEELLKIPFLRNLWL
jgi:hypothetical protein